MTETEIQPEAREVRWIAIRQAVGIARLRGEEAKVLLPELREKIQRERNLARERLELERLDSTQAAMRLREQRAVLRQFVR